jgi:ERCC4-type nuclease
MESLNTMMITKNSKIQESNYKKLQTLTKKGIQLLKVIPKVTKIINRRIFIIKVSKTNCVL